MYIYDERSNTWIPLRETRQYKTKKRLLRDAWIVGGLVMLLLPSEILTLLLPCCGFLSLAFLDESKYSFKIDDER